MKPIILVIAILSLLLARNTAFPLSNHRIDSQKRHLVVTANSYEEAVHIASKCLLGIDMTVAEWKTMYDKITTYIGKNWDDPYLHGQAAVFVATIAIPVTKLSKFSKLNLLNRLKANTKFADKVDDLAKISKVADEGGDVGKVVDEFIAAKGVDEVGKYTTTIEWSIYPKVPVRPFGKGYWGKRVIQKEPRVDAFELKINPNNESYFLAKPDGRFVQFEGISGKALQDGKLIMTKNGSIYHVYDKPYAQASIIKEATSQLEAATFNNLTVEWLVSDQKAVEQLTMFFKEKNIDIIIRYYPE